MKAAGQVFKLAVGLNFIQGRRTKTVAAVCLYIACRRQDGNTTMLIDFADVLMVCFPVDQRLSLFHDILINCLDKRLQTGPNIQSPTGRTPPRRQRLPNEPHRPRKPHLPIRQTARVRFRDDASRQ